MVGTEFTGARPLTRRAVAALRPKEAPYLVKDGGARGLYLRIYPAGARTWYFIHESGGRKRWHALGELDAPLAPEDCDRYRLHEGATLDLDGARIAAAACKAALRAGLDPGDARREAVAEARAARAEARTVADVARVWMEQVIQRRHRRPEYTRRLLDVHLLPAVGALRIERLTRAHIAEVVGAKLQAGHAVTANRILLVAKKLTRFATERGYLEADPLTVMTRAAAGGREKPRERNLGFEELGQIVRLAWSPALPVGPELRGLLKMLVLTGQRAGETAAMRWADVDAEACIWRIPAGTTKSGRPHLVHLSPAAMQVLAETRPVTGLKTYVFQSSRASSDEPQPVDPKALGKLLRELFAYPAAWRPGSRRAKPKEQWQHQRIKRPTERPSLRGVMAPFATHDLRRTMASRMADLGVAPHVIEKLLNHALEGVLAVYQRAELLPERKAAMDSWGAKIEALLAEEPGRVTHLTTRRAA